MPSSKGNRCFVCKNHKTDKKSSVSFHSIPSGRVFQLWSMKISEAVGRMPTKNSLVCSDHFERSQFISRPGRPLLKADTIPTIFKNQLADIGRDKRSNPISKFHQSMPKLLHELTVYETNKTVATPTTATKPAVVPTMIDEENIGLSTNISDTVPTILKRSSTTCSELTEKLALFSSADTDETTKRENTYEISGTPELGCHTTEVHVSILRLPRSLDDTSYCTNDFVPSAGHKSAYNFVAAKSLVSSPEERESLKNENCNIGGLIEPPFSDYGAQMAAQCSTEDVDLLMKVESDDNDIPRSAHPPESGDHLCVNPSILSDTDNEFSRTVLSELWKYCEEGFLCDVTLIVGDESLRAHRVILAATSPVFNAMLKIRKENSNNCFINLKGFDVTTLKLALQYMYTGSLLLPKDYFDSVFTKEKVVRLLSDFKVLGLDVERLKTMQVKLQNGCELLSSGVSFLDLVTAISPLTTTTVNVPDSNKRQYLSKKIALTMVDKDHNYFITRPQVVRATAIHATRIWRAGKGHRSKIMGSKLWRETHLPLSEVQLAAKHKYMTPLLVSTTDLPQNADNATADSLGKRDDLTVNSTCKQELVDSPTIVPKINVVDTDTNNRIEKKRPLLPVPVLEWSSRPSKQLQQNKRQLLPKGAISIIRDNRSISFAEENNKSDSYKAIYEQVPIEDDSKPSKTVKKVLKYNSNSSKKKNSKKVLPEKTIQCTHCSMMFSTHLQMSLHFSRLGLPHPGHICHICGVVFKKRFMLKSHVAWRHMNGEGARKFTCTTCSRSFSFRQNLKRHEITHTGHRPHLCDLCGKGFIQKWSLDDHIARGHCVSHAYARAAPRVQKWWCSVCNETLVGSDGMSKLTTRCETAHPTVPPNIIRIGDPLASKKLKESLDDGPIGYLCETCGENLTTPGMLKLHVQHHHTTNNKFTCEVCSKVLKSAASLEYHTRDHTGQRPFLCSACDMRFKSKGALTMHLSRSPQCSSDPKLDDIGKAIVAKSLMCRAGFLRYRCTTCNQTFRARRALSEHENVHANLKPYGCELCDSRFRQPAHLTRHSLVHTGFKPSVCSLCEKSYKCNVDLKYHYTRFHHVGFKREVVGKKVTYTADLPPSSPLLDPVPDINND